MKYRYEFETDDFIKGFCRGCPLGYVTADAYGYNAVACVLGCLGIECPLEEVEERKKGHWDEIRNAYGELEGWIHTECGHSSNCKSNYCPHCGADMRGEKE